MRVLVVEDNLDILANIVEYLSNHGLSVESAKDGLTGLHLATTKNYDLIVLDIMLPGMDGNKICHTLRQEGRIETPIIMLTARDTLEDKLQGFNSGADDYLVKPFALAELLVRIQAVVGRSRGARRNSIQVGDLHFDLDTFEVVRQGKFIKINPMCRKLLRILMENSPKIVRREKIEKEMWGDSITGGDNLRTHIHLLRQAVDRPFSRPLIHTVPGMGYRLAELD
ncbi:MULTISPECIES: response regulator transcription factor [Pseudomonas]|uniref:response regulator transcription factor n=1 Tax=Pseudomonas TaxID=286 RepID=UPI0008637D2B|nr:MULTISPECIES: response regulator transcription factor [Pseudomonas]MCL8303586.1 response regulator transcription factor [Pseudomonas putida]